MSDKVGTYCVLWSHANLIFILCLLSRARHSAAEGTSRSNASVRRKDVRDVALTLFAERGYHGMTLRDIAEVLGLRAPSLYNHLESKQSLLQEIMFGTMDGLDGGSSGHHILR